MKNIILFLVIITFLSVNLYAGNFFKELEKYAKADKLEKKIKALESENQRLKTELKKYSQTAALDFKIENIADVNKGAYLTISYNHLINGSAQQQREYILTFPGTQLIYSISILDHLSRPVKCLYEFEDVRTKNKVKGLVSYTKDNQPDRLKKISLTDKIIFKLESNIALSRIQVMGVVF